MRLPTELRPPPRRWSLRERPRFLEAYPTFSIGAAHREGKVGKDHLVWRDRHGIVTGAAQAVWISNQRLAVRFTVEERPYYEASSGEIALDVVWKGSQENNRRPFAACPVCGFHVDVLVYIGSWICGGGRHGLRNRSACLSKEVRWSEALTELTGSIAVAEALGTTGKLHNVRLAKRDALVDRLNHRSVTANSLQLAKVTGEWVRPVRLAR